MLQTNPAQATLGVKLPMHMQGRKKRLPFSEAEVRTIFGSPVFTQHLRSHGQSGEATYWIPLIMYYTGARPEEIGGPNIDDVRHAPKIGWYLHITDLPSSEDVLLFAARDRKDVDSCTKGEPRRLRNPASRRNIPVAKELIDLGLLRCVEWVKAQGHKRLFPTLRADSHGKLAGAFGKFFGRLKKELGIASNLKTLYSMRHCERFLRAGECAISLPKADSRPHHGRRRSDGWVRFGPPVEEGHDVFQAATLLENTCGALGAWPRTHPPCWGQGQEEVPVEH